jgi:hypothetical protein
MNRVSLGYSGNNRENYGYWVGRSLEGRGKFDGVLKEVYVADDKPYTLKPRSRKPLKFLLEIGLVVRARQAIVEA